MKAIPVLALASALLFAPNLFAETYIPWHWDDEAAMNGVDNKKESKASEEEVSSENKPEPAKTK
jgi:hypothetical protein